MGLSEIANADTAVASFMRAIGWIPGRSADISEDVAVWVDRGYEVSDAVREFMTECGGLSFEYPRHAAVGGVHTCSISGVDASRRIPRALVAGFEKRIGRDLCPVGQSASGSLFLLMDSEGRTFGGRDDFLAEIAADGFHALLKIRDREKLERL